MFRKPAEAEPAPKSDSKERAPRPRGWRNTMRKGVAGLAIAGSAMTLAACGEDVNATPENTHTPPAVTQTAEPNEPTPGETTVTPGGEIPKPSEVITDPSVSPEDFVTGGIFEYLDPATQETVSTLYNMDTTTFRQQPQEQQTAFVDYVVYNSSPYMNYWLQEAGINLSYTRSPQNAQEYSDNTMYIYTLATHLVEKKANSDGGSTWVMNNELGYKLVAGANFLNGTTTNVWDENIASLNAASVWNIAGLDDQIGTVTSETLNPDGSITYTASNKAGEVVERNIVPVTITSLTGDGAQFTTFLYK